MRSLGEVHADEGGIVQEVHLPVEVLRDLSGEPAAVAAHRVLNSSAIVMTGIDTLLESWDSLSLGERAELLERLRVNARVIDGCLRGLIQHQIYL